MLPMKEIPMPPHVPPSSPPRQPVPPRGRRGMRSRRGPRGPSTLFRTLGATGLGLWIGLLGACVSAPEAEDFLAMGHRDPEQTFRTFQTALAADLPLEEYLCFSEDFLARQQISRQAYLKGRSDLLRNQPWVRLLAEAEVLESRRLDPGHHLIRAVASGPFGIGRTELRVILVPNLYYEIGGSTPDGKPRRIHDAFVDPPLANHFAVRSTTDPLLIELWAVVDVPLDDIDPASIRDFHIGTSWKIDFMEQVEESEENPGEGAPPPEG